MALGAIGGHLLLARSLEPDKAEPSRWHVARATLVTRPAEQTNGCRLGLGGAAHLFRLK